MVIRFTSTSYMHLNSLLSNYFARRIYCSNGPNDIWHCDSYDKIKQYGFPIHGAVDGFSWKILILKVVKSFQWLCI